MEATFTIVTRSGKHMNIDNSGDGGNFYHCKHWSFHILTRRPSYTVGKNFKKLTPNYITPIFKNRLINVELAVFYILSARTNNAATIPELDRNSVFYSHSLKKYIRQLEK